MSEVAKENGNIYFCPFSSFHFLRLSSFFIHLRFFVVERAKLQKKITPKKTENNSLNCGKYAKNELLAHHYERMLATVNNHIITLFSGWCSTGSYQQTI